MRSSRTCRDKLSASILPEQSRPPGLEWEVKILPEVENVEREPADHEETDGGDEEVTPPDVPLLLLQPPGMITSFSSDKHQTSSVRLTSDMISLCGCATQYVCEVL